MSLIQMHGVCTHIPDTKAIKISQKSIKEHKEKCSVIFHLKISIGTKKKGCSEFSLCVIG